MGKNTDLEIIIVVELCSFFGVIVIQKSNIIFISALYFGGIDV